LGLFFEWPILYNNRYSKSISSFVAGFKSSVNTRIDDYIDDCQLEIEKYNKSNHFFQPNYHDHVVRNNQEYQRIKYYIRYNQKIGIIIN